MSAWGLEKHLYVCVDVPPHTCKCTHSYMHATHIHTCKKCGCEFWMLNMQGFLSHSEELPQGPMVRSRKRDSISKKGNLRLRVVKWESPEGIGS